MTECWHIEIFKSKIQTSCYLKIKTIQYYLLHFCSLQQKFQCCGVWQLIVLNDSVWTIYCLSGNNGGGPRDVMVKTMGWGIVVGNNGNLISLAQKNFINKMSKVYNRIYIYKNKSEETNRNIAFMLLIFLMFSTNFNLM